MKRFAEWIGLKERIDRLAQTPPRVAPGEIYWANLGENIGSEINGKGSRFSRPVLILAVLARGFFLVIPLTSQPKSGNWYVAFDFLGATSVACLQQARSLDYRRLLTRMGSASSSEFARIKEGFHALFCAK